MLKINAQRVRELFANYHLTDRQVVSLTGLNMGMVKRIQTDGARVQKHVVFALMLKFPVRREELILGKSTG